MDDIIVEYLEEPDLKDTILIEGLPGVGNVGKLTAEHLIDEIKAKKFAVIYSKFFPPQVLVDDFGVVKLVNNELYYVKRRGKADLVILIGDYQGLSPEGQYDLTTTILDIAEKFGVKMIYTLGGYGLGRMVDEPKVLGAATSKELVKKMKEFDVVFSDGEPGSGIVGASGLLLGLGMLRGIEAVCLMGETSGYFVDPKSARGVLKVLGAVLDIEVDLSALDTKAAQIEKITSKFKDLEKGLSDAKPEDLHYIG
jgi:uncharacterized protein (TIGR00162 family)